MESSRDDFVIAIRSAFLQKGIKQRFSLLTLILFSIIFLALGNFNIKVVEFNRTIIKEIIYISSFIVTIPENTIKRNFNKVSDHFGYYEDYQIVKSELQKLTDKDLEKKIITYENIELKKLIDDYFIEDSQTFAKVLTDKESPFLRSIVINKGSKNGVKAGMVVYDDIYLVGKVVEVNFLTSRVLLISDLNSKVPVTIQQINIQGIMNGLDKQNGQIQYIKGNKLIKKNNEDLIVVTSGLEGVFRSGIPIGKIKSTNISNNKKLVVNFYKNFSQLKYVKILSHAKENINLDQSNKKSFKKNNDKTLELSNLKEDNKTLKQQKNINNEIRLKFELENNKLREDLINTQEKLIKRNKEIKNDKNDNENIEFLKLNLLYGHKCRKNFFKPNLFKINTNKYKTCVLNKGPISKKN